MVCCCARLGLTPLKKQHQPLGDAALMNWWRRGESNPRPEIRPGGLYERIRRLGFASGRPGERLAGSYPVDGSLGLNGSRASVIPLHDAPSPVAGIPGRDGLP